MMKVSDFFVKKGGIMQNAAYLRGLGGKSGGLQLYAAIGPIVFALIV